MPLTYGVNLHFLRTKECRPNLFSFKNSGSIFPFFPKGFSLADILSGGSYNDYRISKKRKSLFAADTSAKQKNKVDFCIYIIATEIDEFSSQNLRRKSRICGRNSRISTFDCRYQSPQRKPCPRFQPGRSNINIAFKEFVNPRNMY